MGPNYDKTTNFNNKTINIKAGAAKLVNPDMIKYNNQINSPLAEIEIIDSSEPRLLNETTVMGEYDEKTGELIAGTNKIIQATTKVVNINPVTGEQTTSVITNPYLEPYDGMTELEMKEAIIHDYFDIPDYIDINTLDYEKDIAPYMETFEIEYYGTDGEMHTTNITAHKKLVERVQAMMKELAESKFPIEIIEGQYTKASAGNSSKLSMHSFGLAFDINRDSNPYFGKDFDGNIEDYYNPEEPTAITQKEAKIFIKYGFFWGGTWTTTKDFMHISCTGF